MVNWQPTKCHCHPVTKSPYGTWEPNVVATDNACSYQLANECVCQLVTTCVSKLGIYKRVTKCVRQLVTKCVCKPSLLSNGNQICLSNGRRIVCRPGSQCLRELANYSVCQLVPSLYPVMVINVVYWYASVLLYLAGNEI